MWVEFRLHFVETNFQVQHVPGEQMQPFHSALLLCNYVQLYSSLFYAHSRPESARVRAVLLSRVYAKQHLVKNRTFEEGEKKKALSLSERMFINCVRNRIYIYLQRVESTMSCLFLVLSIFPSHLLQDTVYISC